MQRITVQGKMVPKNAFWLRRLKCGDCILIQDVPKIQTHEVVENDDTV